MVHAFYLFHSWNKNKGYNNSKAYETNRKEFIKLDSKLHKGQTPWNKGLSFPYKPNLKKRDVQTWMKGKNHTEEAKAKNREAHLGKKTSLETRAKLSATHKGQVPWIKGKHWWNNGLENKCAIECPEEGWKRGRLSYVL